jgi:hypothetical protein
MEFCQVLLEAHDTAATIYVAGLLADLAATRTEEIVGRLNVTTRVVRLDLRAVAIIDPRSFVVIARALNRWRDVRGGQLRIQFPERSKRPRNAHLQLIGQTSAIPMAVSTAITCPMSTSPG